MSSSPPAKSTPSDWLEQAIRAVGSARVTILGDFCLDAYWLIDTGATELSLETGLPVRYVREQRYSLGGAGNVAANLAALGVREVRVIGVIGNDLFGEEMVRQMSRAGIKTDALLKLEKPWQTSVYAKPFLGSEELNRMDIGAFNQFPESRLDEILGRLDEASKHSDVVILNQQLPGSFMTEKAIRRMNPMIARHGNVVFLVDSRAYAGHFEGAVLKVNAHEAARMLARERPLQESISRAEAIELAQALTARTGRPVFLTRGEHGLLVVHGAEVIEVPAIEVPGKTDTVGAGDTVVAAIAAVLGGGGGVELAARLANLAASITVRKLRVTGTATIPELREAAPK